MSNKIYIVDLINQSIALRKIKFNPKESIDTRCLTSLRLDDDIMIDSLRSKYKSEQINPSLQLTNYLTRLSQTSELSRSEVIFGCYQDPFHPFEGKFDHSMRLLEVFSRFNLGHLTIQTRSPLLVIALPILKRLGNRVSVNISLETNLEEIASKYTPGLARVEERLKLIRALKRFGIETNIIVSPVLPYGHWQDDAQNFAKILCENSNYLHIQPFDDRRELKTRSLRNHGTIVKLAEDRKFHWLRKDSAKPLIEAVKKIDKLKLIWPQRECTKPRQLEIFAA